MIPISAKHKWKLRQRQVSGSPRAGWKFNAWKFSVPLGAGLAKMRNGKASRWLRSHSRDRFETPIPPRLCPDCQPTFVVSRRPGLARSLARQIVKRWARRTGIPSRRAPMALFHRVAPRSRLTPLSRGPQFTGRDSPALLRCLPNDRRRSYAP